MIEEEIADKIESVTGSRPSSKDEAVFFIHEHLEDLGEDSYSDIGDLDVLLDVLTIYENGSISVKNDPYMRKGRIIPIDEWDGISEINNLVDFAIENGWKVEKLKSYYTFSFDKRLIFKIDNSLRGITGKGYSCKIKLPRIVDMTYLFSFLDNFNLNQFKSRNWKTKSIPSMNNKPEAIGRYFLIEELRNFIIEIPKRI
jgi:hypothetical protein